MTDDVFTADQPGESEPSVLDQLVGEGKKFKTLDDLAKGKLEADAFIEKLKEENQMALEELTKLQGKEEEGTKIKELLDLVKNQNTESKDNQAEEVDLDAKIREILQGVSSEQTAKANRDKGNALVLDKVGGDKEAAKTFVAERAKQLGLQPKDLADLSERSPEAFAKLIGSENKGQSSTGSLPGGANSQAMGNTSNANETIEGHHTKAYYDRMRKEMGTRKYLADHRLQNQLMKDAMALGSRFNP